MGTGVGDPLERPKIFEFLTLSIDDFAMAPVERDKDSVHTNAKISPNLESF